MSNDPIDLDLYRCKVSRRHAQRRRQHRFEASAKSASAKLEQVELSNLLAGIPADLGIEATDVRHLLYVVPGSGKVKRGVRRLIADND